MTEGAWTSGGGQISRACSTGQWAWGGVAPSCRVGLSHSIPFVESSLSPIHPLTISIGGRTQLLTTGTSPKSPHFIKRPLGAATRHLLSPRRPLGSAGF